MLKNILIGVIIAFIFPCFAGAEKQNDWFEFYYQKPAPDLFVHEIRAVAESGYFHKKSARNPLIVFMSQVIKANPDKIQEWMDELSDLLETERRCLFAAAWYSDTEYARKYFRGQNLTEYLKQKAPNILELPIDNPAILDMLWGYFHATGQEEPVRRIIKALELSGEEVSGKEESLERYKTSRKTDKDMKKLYLNLTFQAAMRSVASQCKQHARVLEICEKLFNGDSLSKSESLWLGAILTQVKPEKYKIETEKNVEQKH